jgi:hypothetical protein
VLVSIGRDCAAMPAPWPCRDGCPPPAVLRHGSVPVELVQRGNAIYYRNEAIPGGGFDRIVRRRDAAGPAG